MIKYLILLLLTSCGINVHGQLDPVTIKPVDLVVTTSVNLNAAKAYCSSICNGDDICTNNCYNQFLSVFGAATLATPSPTPGN